MQSTNPGPRNLVQCEKGVLNGCTQLSGSRESVKEQEGTACRVHESGSFWEGCKLGKRLGGSYVGPSPYVLNLIKKKKQPRVKALQSKVHLSQSIHPHTNSQDSKVLRMVTGEPQADNTGEPL